MSERYTAANAPGVVGWMDYGRKSRAEMIERFRSHYRHQLEQAQKALAYSDDEIEVTTFLGVHVQRNKEVVTE